MKKSGQVTLTKIKASAFPHWLKHEDDSKLYQINGPNHHVRRFVGQRVLSGVSELAGAPCGHRANGVDARGCIFERDFEAPA